MQIDGADSAVQNEVPIDGSVFRLAPAITDATDAIIIAKEGATYPVCHAFSDAAGKHHVGTFITSYPTSLVSMEGQTVTVLSMRCVEN